MSIPLSYIIQTTRCTLRAPSVEDIPYIFDATRFHGFNDGMLWDPPTEVEQLQEPLRQALQAWQTGEAFSFSIDRTSDRTFLGRISIRSTQSVGKWNVGFWMHPNYQRQGYMTEAAQAVLIFGFESLDASSIEACYATWNLASEQVLKKIGMTFVEHIPCGFKKAGQRVAENRVAILRKPSWSEFIGAEKNTGRAVEEIDASFRQLRDEWDI